MNEKRNDPPGCGCHECRLEALSQMREMEALAQTMRELEHHVKEMEAKMAAINYASRHSVMGYTTAIQARVDPALLGAVSVAGAGRGGEVSLAPMIPFDQISPPEPPPSRLSRLWNARSFWTVLVVLFVNLSRRLW